MAVVVAQVTEPSSTRPGLDLHRQFVAFRRVILRSDLFKQGRKGVLKACVNVNFLRYG
jgi:hypothetical protein